jgi:hypothetical protein
MKLLIVLLGASFVAQAHDVITTPITWDREISRIVYDRCVSCHHVGGSAFSLMSYSDIRPWAESVKEEVLARRMPPWGAIKGFGDFRDDQGLTAEQIEIIANWANGGVPEGDPKDLPASPKTQNTYQVDESGVSTAVSGELKLDGAIVLDGLDPKMIPKGASFQITAELFGQGIEPLLWLSDYRPQFRHLFLFRTPIEMPAGTVIHGIPSDATILLLLALPKPDRSVAEEK